MPEAARITDEIKHTFALLGLIAGAILGAVVGALIVCTGGAAAGALAVAAAAGGGASLGSMIGKFIGSLVPGFTTGAITGICSPNVMIGGLLAARATADFSMCSGIILSHPSSLIAQGSKTVQINGLPAARKTDKLVCGASISSGCATVFIGEEAGTFLDIDSEVPAWLEYTMIGLGLLSGATILRLGLFGAARLTWVGVARVLGAGYLGSRLGGEGASWLGGELFGKGSKLQRIMGFVGSFLGGIFAGGIAYRGAPRLPPGPRAPLALPPGPPPPKQLPAQAGPVGHISPSEVVGKTPAEIHARAQELGLQPRGPDPANGRGAYIDPQTRTQRILSHPNDPPYPHGHVNNPAGQRIGPNGEVVAPESPAAHLPIRRQ